MQDNTYKIYPFDVAQDIFCLKNNTSDIKIIKLINIPGEKNTYCKILYQKKKPSLKKKSLYQSKSTSFSDCWSNFYVSDTDENNYITKDIYDSDGDRINP